MTILAHHVSPRLLRRLGRDRRGLALLEFAFIFPVFLTLSLTGAELTNYIIVRMRVSQLALQLADNAARIGSGSQLQAKRISERDINDLLTGAGLQADELKLFQRGRVVVTSLEPTQSPNTNPAQYKIGWKRCRGSKAYTSSYSNKTGNFTGGLGVTTPVDRRVIAPDNGATMFVEVVYDYQPLIKTSLSPSTTITEIASMMVRDRRDTTQVYNDENEMKSLCS
ncbi:TadE/TadG family type IV pilus assembly protein [Sphingomonas sp. RS2018]